MASTGKKNLEQKVNQNSKGHLRKKFGSEQSVNINSRDKTKNCLKVNTVKNISVESV